MQQLSHKTNSVRILRNNALQLQMAPAPYRVQCRDSASKDIAEQYPSPTGTDYAIRFRAMLVLHAVGVFPWIFNKLTFARKY